MSWQRIEPHVSFHDLDSYFLFEVSFRDWQERLVRIHFHNATHIVCSPLGGLSPLDQCPGEGMYTVEDSPLIRKLRECRVLGQDEPAKHYMLFTSSSQEEWCEVVAEAHSVAIEDADV
jgi:hypothetical protein